MVSVYKKHDARKMKKQGRVGLREIILKKLMEKESPSQIAKELGVSRQYIYKLKKRLDELGSFEKAVKEDKTGPKDLDKVRKLSFAQQRSLIRKIMNKRPDQLRFDFALWTLKAVRELAKRLFQVELSKSTLGRYLKNWGFSFQRPARFAPDQDPVLVENWLLVDYPSIEARAKREDARIFWGDETGIKKDTNWVRGASLIGVTPKIAFRNCLSHTEYSMISAVNNQGKVYFEFVNGSVDALCFLEFMKNLVDQNKDKKIFLIVDNAKIHHAKLIQPWLKANQEKIELFYLPPYMPEYNPDEFLNRGLKTHIRSSSALTHEELLDKACEYMDNLNCSLTRIVNGVVEYVNVVCQLFTHSTTQYAGIKYSILNVK